MKKIVVTLSVLMLLTSCVSKKKYTDLENQNKTIQDLLNTATVKLNSCIEDKAGLNATLAALKDQNEHLKSNNKDLINSTNNMTVLVSPIKSTILSRASF